MSVLSCHINKIDYLKKKIRVSIKYNNGICIFWLENYNKKKTKFLIRHRHNIFI